MIYIYIYIYDISGGLLWPRVVLEASFSFLSSFSFLFFSGLSFFLLLSFLRDSFLLMSLHIFLSRLVSNFLIKWTYGHGRRAMGGGSGYGFRSCLPKGEAGAALIQTLST